MLTHITYYLRHIYYRRSEDKLILRTFLITVVFVLLAAFNWSLLHVPTHGSVMGILLGIYDDQVSAQQKDPVVDYRLNTLEKDITRLNSQHDRISTLLVANLAGIATSLAVYFLTRRKDGGKH